VGKFARKPHSHCFLFPFPFRYVCLSIISPLNALHGRISRARASSTGTSNATQFGKPGLQQRDLLQQLPDLGLLLFHTAVEVRERRHRCPRLHQLLLDRVHVRGQLFCVDGRAAGLDVSRRCR
jgi:hypothetical protein